MLIYTIAGLFIIVAGLGFVLWLIRTRPHRELICFTAFIGTVGIATTAQQLVPPQAEPFFAAGVIIGVVCVIIVTLLTSVKRSRN